MLGRLENMQQMIANLKGNEGLIKSISILTRSAQDALRGYSKKQPKSKIRKPEKQILSFVKNNPFVPSVPH